MALHSGQLGDSLELSNLPHYFVVSRKQALLLLELRGVDEAALGAIDSRVFQMQHFVVEHIFEQKTGNLWAVEYAADHDRIVSRVKMSQ